MKAFMIALLGVFALSLTACNTIEGAGKDVKATSPEIRRERKQAHARLSR